MRWETGGSPTRSSFLLVLPVTWPAAGHATRTVTHPTRKRKPCRAYRANGGHPDASQVKRPETQYSQAQSSKGTRHAYAVAARDDGHPLTVWMSGIRQLSSTNYVRMQFSSYRGICRMAPFSPFFLIPPASKNAYTSRTYDRTPNGPDTYLRNTEGQSPGGPYPQAPSP